MGVGRVASLLGSILLGACSVVGVRSGTEEPPFTVVERLGEIEVRQYGARVAAETTVDQAEMPARSEGFGCLAGYIFGRNAGSARIAMTAPVAQEDAGGEVLAMTAPVAQGPVAQGPVAQGPVAQGPVAQGPVAQGPVAQGPDGVGSTIRFFLPAGLTATAAPRPLDARVRIVEVPAQTVAVLRFSGSTGPEAVAARKAALLAGLSATRWTAESAPFAWFYDPPWTLPPLRRNEVAVPVRRGEPAVIR